MRNERVYLEMESIRRQVSGGFRVQLSPGLVSGACKPTVQKKKKLIRAAVYRGWLPKGEPGSDGAFQPYAFRGNLLFEQELDEAGPGRARPDVVT